MAQPQRQRSGLVVYGTYAAASISGYYAYKWLQQKYSTSVEQRKSQNVDRGRTKITESCEIWESGLRKAVDSGDTAQADKLRQVLRRAYQTLDALEKLESGSSEHNHSDNQHYGANSGFGASPNSPMLDRGYLEKLNRRTNFRSPLDDDDSDETASHASFESAISTLRDIDGTALSVNNVLSPLRVKNPRSNQRDLWQHAQLLAQRGEVKCRKIRSEYTKCKNDLDYLARMHCFREAVSVIMKDETQRAILKDPFMHVLSGILIKGGSDPEIFKTKIAKLEKFVFEQVESDNLEAVSAELYAKGIKEINFYDVAIDFLLYDALDAIKLPPASVKKVLQSQWVPTSIRVQSVKAAVWTIVRGRLMLFKKGSFMAHFYDVVTVIGPALSCGLLGVGNAAFVKVNKEFWDLVVEFFTEVFAIPGSDSAPGLLTPEIYADKITKIVKHYVPRATQMVAAALEAD